MSPMTHNCASCKAPQTTTPSSLEQSKYATPNLPLQLPVRYLLITSLLATTVLSACGGGSSAPPATLATVDILQGDNSVLADDVATTTIQRIAANNAAQGLSSTISGFNILNASSDRSSNSFSAGATRTLFSDDSNTKRALTSSLSMFDDVFDDSETIESDSERLLEASLGLGESSSATVTREGNLITIDPDDAELCAGETFFFNGSNELDLNSGFAAAANVGSTDQDSSLDAQICQQMASQITVQLAAQTEQSGTISYLFNQQAFLDIGYGPINASYELSLNTLHTMQQMSDQLSGASSTTQSMSGAIRVTSSVNNSLEGQLAGSSAFVVSKAISVIENDGNSFTLAPATVFTSTHNEAAGTAHLQLGLGALQVVSIQAADEFSDTPIETRLSVGGLSGTIDFTDSGESVTVSKFGFPNGPLTLNIANELNASLTLDPFGFSKTNSSGEVVLNTALNIRVSAQGYVNDALQLDFSLSAPAQTLLDTETDNDHQRVKSGGPVTFSYQAHDSANSLSGSVIWAPGSCQSSSSGGSGDQALYSCDDF